MSKTVVITGVAGQSGSFLAEQTIARGDKVIGIARRHANPNYDNISSIIDNPNFELLIGDITDQSFIFSCLSKYKPDEFYNLAAESFVKYSFDCPSHVFNVDTVGVLNILEGIRSISPKTRLYQASTSETFGKSVSFFYDVQGCAVRRDGPLIKDSSYENRIGFEYMSPQSASDGIFQDENTPFIPQSPYAIAKLAAYHMCRLYRESYGLFVSSGILFNHEGTRRGKEFVTRKVTDYVARLWNHSTVKHTGYGMYSAEREGFVDFGQHNGYSYIPENLRIFPKLKLGNLDAMRDWGSAEDYVQAMQLMLSHDTPDDFVISTGESHSIKELCQEAFSYVGLNWEDYVEADDKFKRPAEVNYLCGDSSKARSVLGWETKVKFKELIIKMVKSDMEKQSGIRR